MAIQDIAELLGGEHVLPHPIQTRLDLVAVGKTGVTKRMLLHLAESLGVPLNQMAPMLPIAERTLQRYAPDKPFNRIVSEQILQLAEVVARGIEVFGDKTRFLTWLNHPNQALADRTPIDLLSSRFGAELVLDALGRIEHGIFS